MSRKQQTAILAVVILTTVATALNLAATWRIRDWSWVRLPAPQHEKAPPSR